MRSTRSEAGPRPANESGDSGPEAAPRRINRRRWLAGASLAAAVVPLGVAIDGVAITPRRLVTSTHTCGSASGVDPLRILQVSDLHVHGIGTLEQQLLEGLHGARADLIVLTGDAIDRAASLPALDTLLAEFPTGPRRLAILGNWEYRCGVSLRDLEKTYDRHGVELLVNRSVEFDHRGWRMRITGLDDIVGGRPDAALAVASVRPLDEHLVLAHCPITRDSLAMPPDHSVSLVLSGHTHGGQVAPFGLATILPRGCGRYVAGWYRDDGPPMYVSRGIGTSLFPVRIGATPELVVIDWHR